MIIVVDASALVAIAQRELGWELYDDVLGAAEEIWATPVNLLEASLALVMRNSHFSADQFSAWIGVQRVATSHAVDYRAALDAYLRYGKGIHRAGLNLGDCFAYALAKALDAPLLFKGDDFIRTDVRSAL